MKVIVLQDFYMNGKTMKAGYVISMDNNQYNLYRPFVKQISDKTPLTTLKVRKKKSNGINK